MCTTEIGLKIKLLKSVCKRTKGICMYSVDSFYNWAFLSKIIWDIMLTLTKHQKYFYMVISQLFKGMEPFLFWYVMLLK